MVIISNAHSSHNISVSLIIVLLSIFNRYCFILLNNTFILLGYKADISGIIIVVEVGVTPILVILLSIGYSIEKVSELFS